MLGHSETLSKTARHGNLEDKHVLNKIIPSFSQVNANSDLVT